jgi:hypothetical protein
MCSLCSRSCGVTWCHLCAGDADAATTVRSARVPAPFTPWGVYGAAASGSKGKAAGAGTGAKSGKLAKPSKGAAPAVEFKTPKALLQQHCVRGGWAPPRFEKLSAASGGSTSSATAAVAAAAAAVAAGGSVLYRYKVTLVPAVAAAGGGGGAGSSRPTRHGSHTAPRCFQLPADEDGWPSVQDAQNAAAARALYVLLSGGSSSSSSGVAGGATTDAAAVFAQLESQWAELWQHWWEQQSTAAAAAAAAASAGVDGHSSSSMGNAGNSMQQLSVEEQQQVERDVFVRWADLRVMCGVINAVLCAVQH